MEESFFYKKNIDTLQVNKRGLLKVKYISQLLEDSELSFHMNIKEKQILMQLNMVNIKRRNEHLITNFTPPRLCLWVCSNN